MYKIIHNLGPPFLQDIISKSANLMSGNVSGNTRAKSLFYNYKAPNTVNYGLETLRCLGPKIYNMLPVEIQNSTNIKIFKDREKI